MNELMDNKSNFIKKDEYKTSRLMFIIEAALEYFISILVAGAYLAKIASLIGMSDSLIGILTAFVSLGCGFQIFSLFLSNKKSVKKTVTILHILNQLCFALIYCTPILRISKTAKTIVFIILLLLGHIVNNVINSPKINWFMTLVDNKKRGRFTANKEIVSLIGGMVFSYMVGIIIDHYENIGQTNKAFIICAITIFILTLLHILTLIFSKEKTKENFEKIDIKDLFIQILKNKRVLKVILITVMWNIAQYATIPFFGSYQIKELGFSMKFVSILGIIYAIVRASFSKVLGKYADKTSFIKMLNVCYIIVEIGFFINIFTTPSNGKILYTLYYVLSAIAQAGINSGTINLIYDEVEEKQRMGAYAIQQTIAGIIGFITTSVVSILVAYIQKNGNIIFGKSIYAQQFISIIGFLVVAIILIYIKIAFKKQKKSSVD